MRVMITLSLSALAAFVTATATAATAAGPPPRIGTCTGGSCPSGSANAQLIWPHAGGAPFIPRGVNFIRLSANIGGADGPSHPGYHSTFSPQFYAGNRTAYIAALDALQQHGYNVLRVFIDPGGWTRFDGINGDSADQPLSQPYLRNVADFVTLASARGLYVNPTLDATPLNPHFTKQCGSDGCGGKCGGYPNNQMMDGAPHSHFLPCHSFPHTNLKSPCAEQGSASQPRPSTSSSSSRGCRCALPNIR